MNKSSFLSILIVCFLFFDSCKGIKNNLKRHWVDIVYPRDSLDMPWELAVGKYEYMITRMNKTSIRDISFYYDKRNKLEKIIENESPRRREIFFYKNGNVKYILEIISNELNGLTYFFSKTGKLKAIYEYEKNKLVSMPLAPIGNWPSKDSLYVPIKISKDTMLLNDY